MNGKGAEFLTRLLNTITKQIFTDFEIIVADHSLNYDVKDVCSNFDKLNIVYIKNEQKRGNSPANLNVGLDYAKGDIIKIMFQDDFFVSVKSLSIISNFFEITNYKWAVNGCCETENFTNFYKFMIPKWNNNILKGVNTISSPSVLSFLNKNVLKFDERLTMMMDCDYYYSLYCKYGLPGIINDCLIANTSHQHQISKMYDKDLEAEINLVNNKYMNLENDGERMDINYYNINYNDLDMYQKSHYKRYEAARALMKEDFVVGDMACGSGYGSLMLAERCKEVHGVDIDGVTINEIKNRYKDEQKVTFYQKNLLDVDFENKFDVIVSFETVEHFSESEIPMLMKAFHRALKPGGFLLFSTPYNQEKIPASIKWHKTFYITENKAKELTQNYFHISKMAYQDYTTHNLNAEGHTKHFIICKANKL